MMDKRAAIIGSIVGDAIGVPVEFEPREKLDLKPVTDMREFGTYNQPKGTWSDDTSMTLCVMENIVDGHDLNPDMLAQNWCNWYTEAKWTPYNEVFDIGTSTANALYDYSKRGQWYKCGNSDMDSNGNGSLMRAIPSSIYLSKFPNEIIIGQSAQISSITHAHTISMYCCSYHALLVKYLLQGQDLNSALSSVNNVLYPVNVFMNKEDKEQLKRILDLSILNVDRDDILGDGYVVHSLEAMLWCLNNHSDFKTTVLSAVNLGEDTDTTACIVGGIAGLIYGMDQIPKEWIDCLARLEDINILVDKYLEKVECKETNFSISCNSIYWL